MKYYYYDNAPKNVVLWACSYETTDSSDDILTRKEPVQGIIVKNEDSIRSWRSDYLFYETKKDGTIKKSSKVRARNRIYADTKEEAIEMYNECINREIQYIEDSLKRKIESLIKMHKDNIIK